MKKTEADTYILIGLRYLQDEDNKLAIDFFSSAIDTNPNIAEAYQFRGIAHYFLKEYQAALEISTTPLPWILHLKMYISFGPCILYNLRFTGKQ